MLQPSVLERTKWVTCVAVLACLTVACERTANQPVDEQPRFGEGSKSDRWGGEADEVTCADGVDNDGDGFTDCCDWDCSDNWNVTVCADRGQQLESDNASCSDGIDNDGDCYTDCKDWDCSRNPNVTVCGLQSDAGEDAEVDARAADAGSEPDAALGATDCQAVAGLPPEADALRDAQLRAWMQQQMQRDHLWFDYSEARAELFASVAVRPDGLLHSVYTDDQTRSIGSYVPDGFNTEHSWPRSWGAHGQAEADLHHLFVSNEDANHKRASYPFGETACTDRCLWQRDGSSLGPDAFGAIVFEVHEESRGDIARAQFYFATRYGYPIDSTMEATLRQWHCEDPPDEWERLRHQRIAQRQHNRNLFVDYPGLVTRIADF